jgi:hypothetical protein
LQRLLEEKDQQIAQIKAKARKYIEVSHVARQSQLRAGMTAFSFQTKRLDEDKAAQHREAMKRTYDEDLMALR